MSAREHFVIVGGALAGLRGAEALHDAGYQGRISVIGAEKKFPYNRPPLSKKILTGEQALTELHFPIADRIDVAWRLGQRAARLDMDAQMIHLEDGEIVHYDKLLITTGASPVIPPIPGTTLAGIHILHDTGHAEALRANMAADKSLVILGAGFIGCEVAASARKLGMTVTIVDRLAWPMNRVMGREMADLFRGIHEEQGVVFRMEKQVRAFIGEERVRGVVLDDGEEIPADLVLVGVGSAPVVNWLKDSGLEIQNGVLCDPCCLAVNGKGRVAAAGDVAAWPHLGFGGEVIRMEHWTNAFEQGAAAALALISANPSAYVPLPSFWSDQYSHKIQSLGRPRATDHAIVSAGSLESRKFVVEYSDEHGLTGVISVGMPARMAGYRRTLAAEIQRRAQAWLQHNENFQF